MQLYWLEGRVRPKKKGGDNELQEKATQFQPVYIVTHTSRKLYGCCACEQTVCERRNPGGLDSPQPQ